MKTLEAIRKRIEDQITAEMPSVLIEKAVNYHCRQGIRTWCDCSFCKKKKEASWAIGSGYQCPSYRSSNPTTGWVDRWEWGLIVAKDREAKREVYRKQLNDLKKEL